MPADERPLSRWSRRKAAMRGRGGAAPVIADAPPVVSGDAADVAASVDTAAPVAAGRDGEITPTPSEDAAALDLPDIDSLDRDSDFTAFMKEGVPAYLRNLAMRKLWASDPALANLDGLIDYGEDFTDIKSGVFEAVKTVLDADGQDGKAAEQRAARSAEPATDPETAQTEGKSGEEVDDPADDDTTEGDRVVAAEDEEIRPESGDDMENAKA